MELMHSKQSWELEKKALQSELKLLTDRQKAILARISELEEMQKQQQQDEQQGTKDALDDTEGGHQLEFEDGTDQSKCTADQQQAKDGTDQSKCTADQHQQKDLECRRCNKFIMNRIKGLHILWHLNTDLSIVRYACKHCHFKHDRPQSVAAHGLREHNDETACVDLLITCEFGSQFSAMSKDCFGVEQLFGRRNRLERCARCAQPTAAAGNDSCDKGIIGSGGANSQQHMDNDESKQSQQFPRQHNFQQQNLVNPKVGPTNEKESANGDEDEAPTAEKEERKEEEE